MRTSRPGQRGSKPRSSAKPIAVPALATVIYAGNNIVARGDTATRAYEVRLEQTGHENPELKLALSFTREHQGAILGALLAVARHPPMVGEVATRFPDWEALVAGPVMALANKPKLLDDMATAKLTPEAEGELVELLQAIVRMDASGNGVPITAMLADEDKYEGEGEEKKLVAKGARSALSELFPSNKLQPNLSTILWRKYRDKAAGGLRLRIFEAKKANGAPYKLYRVESAKPDEDAPI